MGVLIVILIASALHWLNIIADVIFMITVISSLVWMCIASILYFKFGFLKFFYHDLLGWHRPDDSTQTFDGISERAICKYCGKVILRDSQGNWF